MTAPAIVIGLGQDAAGDDAVGLAVARALAARGLDARTSADASLVTALLGAGRRVVIVDAVVGAGPPGAVWRLTPDELATGRAPLSSHGLGVAEALALAAVVHGPLPADAVAIVGVSIAPPIAGALGLSPTVAAAVAPAAALAAELAGAR